jgi:hypothetical protein
MGVPDEPTTGVKVLMRRRGVITEECDCEVVFYLVPHCSLLTLAIPLLCPQNLPFPITTYPTMTNIQLRHPIGKGAAEARIPLLEPKSRLIHLSLACDQCRKTKSKCERSKSDDDPCKSCLAAGTRTTSFSLTPTTNLTPLPSLHISRYPHYLSPTTPL